MIKKTVFAFPFIFAAFASSASTLNSVTCSEYSVSMTFAADIQDASSDVTKASIGTSSAGPFTAFSASSSISVEGARNVTITLSDNDVIDLGQKTSSGNCVLKVDQGFIAGVTTSSSIAE